MAILREHLIDKIPVSEVCDKHGVQPTMFYAWQKKLFTDCIVRGSWESLCVRLLAVWFSLGLSRRSRIMATKVWPSQRLFKRFEERVILGEMTALGGLRTAVRVGKFDQRIRHLSLGIRHSPRIRPRNRPSI